ncbi:MAG: tRNA (N(6)-L-threonylcarbamoyladenosine(37)-C(2))-methylthiotransferase [Candidatus Micrarchaeota archaeon]|nr:tRNA (N(6)-L-threonylcarbamoyladenosine(37)-C(2))-methylthiotransferase [Candidatus Micrarchaeota archaeon]
MKASIRTYGCTLNHADSDIISSILLDSGVELTDEASSDVLIINTCTVKSITAQKILYRLSQMERQKRRVIVTGCMAGANRDLIEKYAPSASIVTTQNIGSIPEVVSSTSRQVMLKNGGSERLGLLTHFGGVISRVAVNDGCLSSCSFCETKLARGPLRSFSEGTIIRAIEQGVEAGAKEVQLTSQDMGAYGRDRKTDIVHLLERIADLKGDFRVRIGMMNPEHLGRSLERIAELMNSGRFYRFIHIPIESGSDSILKAMRRNYTMGQIKAYIDYLRKNVRGIGIETDLIVGFPGETDHDFKQSLDAVRDLRFEVTNISRFGTRPHAEASEMEQLPKETINERSKEATRVVRAVQRGINERYIGKRVDVLFTEDAGSSVNGRIGSYRQVVVMKGGAEPGLGERRDVLIERVSANALYGKVC